MTSTQVKSSFLVVYDYETGGVWGLVTARDESEIAARYPVLKVVQDRPDWMTDEAFAVIQERMAFDIDEPQPDWVPV